MHWGESEWADALLQGLHEHLKQELRGILHQVRGSQGLGVITQGRWSAPAQKQVDFCK